MVSSFFSFIYWTLAGHYHLLFYFNPKLVASTQFALLCFSHEICFTLMWTMAQGSSKAPKTARSVFNQRTYFHTSETRIRVETTTRDTEACICIHAAECACLLCFELKACKRVHAFVFVTYWGPFMSLCHYGDRKTSPNVANVSDPLDDLGAIFRFRLAQVMSSQV